MLHSRKQMEKIRRSSCLLLRAIMENMLLVFVVLSLLAVMAASSPPGVDMQKLASDQHADEKLDFAGNKLYPRNGDVVTVTLEHDNQTENMNTTEGPYFEYCEKQWYINQTMGLLTQLLCYSEYEESLSAINGTTTDNHLSAACGIPNGGNRVDEVLERRSRELNDMSLLELERMFHNVTNAAKTGNTGVHLSSLCCNVG